MFILLFLFLKINTPNLYVLCCVYVHFLESRYDQEEDKYTNRIESALSFFECSTVPLAGEGGSCDVTPPG